MDTRPSSTQKQKKSKPDLQVWIFEIMPWQGLQYVNGTLDDELKKDDVQEIRELLDDYDST